MATHIHPTAIIDPKAELADDVKVGPYSCIGPHVKLGPGTDIKAHVVLDGHTEIGAGTVIYPFCSIGGPPQDLKYDNEPSRLIIGKNNTIREHVTMNTGTAGGGMETRIGDHCLFMAASHVAHDCQVGSNVIMANNATLGGHVHIGDYAIIGGLAAIHQFIRIGAHAIIGGMSGVESDVIPFGRVKGERAYLAGLNLIGLERRGFDKDQLRELQRAFNQLFGREGTLEQRLDSVAEDFQNNDTILSIIDFARQESKFPLCQPPKKT